jgi:micrococcal nuclease
MKRLVLIAAWAVLCVGCAGAAVGGDSETILPTSGVGAASDSPGDTPAQIGGRETALVTRVVDGDTIDVDLNGVIKRIRYIGMDTPETVDPDSPVECFGPEASERNQALVAGQMVELEKDVSETDQYGRLLRYVYVGDRMINEELVLEGFATVATFPPDVKYIDRFVEAERQAREAGRGLWSGCRDNTQPLLSGGCPQGCISPPPGCEIKGNINSSGVKIYHVPSGDYYDATVIDTLRGERWFCTPDEAVANGWRASKR